jgi:phosphatidylinositol glycan class B
MRNGGDDPKGPADGIVADDRAQDVKRPGREIPAVVILVILVLAAIPMALAGASLGILHPDEVFQVLEPAYRLVHGYGTVTWEWNVGLRNWATPFVFSCLLAGSEKMGLTDPFAYRAVLLIPQYLLHVGMLGAIYRLARDEGGSRVGLLTVILVGTYSATLIYAGHPLGESLSVPFLVMGLELIGRVPSTAATATTAGMLLGCAVVVRYGSLIFVLAICGWLVVCRSWRALGFFSLGGLAVALGLGVLDWVTWGFPFHSLIKYSEFNLFSGEAALQFGSEPWWYFIPRLLKVPAWAWLGIAVVLHRRSKTAALLLSCALLYLAIISRTAHKELRFLYPVQILLTIEGAIGLAMLAPKVSASLRPGFWILILMSSTLPYVWRTDLLDEDIGRATARATRPAEVTGIIIFARSPFWTGGHFYVGKEIPIVVSTGVNDSEGLAVALADERMNRVVIPSSSVDQVPSRSFTLVERVGRYAILSKVKSIPRSARE